MSVRSISKRNTTIDLLKFIFALIIVLFHGCKNLPDQTFHFINGRLGVEFFFIVSGYLMVVSAKKYAVNEEVSVWRQTGRFIRDKIIRLSPDVFIAWFVAFIVMFVVTEKDRLVHKFLSGVFEFFFLRQAGFTEQTQANGAVWYLSAMILSMSILFPILARKRDFYLHWFAPLAAIFLYGWISVKFEGFTGSTAWGGFATKGMLRALAGLCLGAVCYVAAEKLKQFTFRLFGKICLSVVALLSIAYVIYTIYGHNHSAFDFVLVVMYALGITLVFSGRGLNILDHAPAFLNCIVVFLGEFSFDLFLSHSYWSRRLGILLPNLSGSRLLAAYLVISFVNALLLMLVSKLLRNKWPAIRRGLEKLFIKQDQ